MARPPKTFAGFIGQRRVVTTLEDLATGAMQHSGRIPNLALIGASGLGKSALAEALARRLSNCADDDTPANLRVVHAGGNYSGRLRDVLVHARHGDIVFIDEAHAGRRRDHELLYLAMDRSETLAVDDSGHLDRTRFEPIAEVSFIFATNRPGGLPNALCQRVVALELERYSRSELRTIAAAVAKRHGMELTSQAARIVAEHGDTPRRIEQILEVARTMRGTKMTQGDIEFVLRDRLGFDEHGSTPHQRELLRALAQAPNRSMTASEIVHVLGLDAVHVREEIEAPLVRLGMIRITNDRRRVIEPKGWSVLEPPEPEAPPLAIPPATEVPS